MPDPDHPSFPAHPAFAGHPSLHGRAPSLKSLAAGTVPPEAAVSSAGRQEPSGPLPTLEHDREVLAWLQCSPQLDGEVRGYLVDALLDWALGGRGYPQMAVPDAGPASDHLQELRQIIGRFPRRIAEARTVGDKLELGRAGRLLSRALRAAWDPQYVQDALDRELAVAMPWLAATPARGEAPDGWRS